MSVKITEQQAQIPLYLNGSLQGNERIPFEKALKEDPQLKEECKEFHEIESVTDVGDQITNQHFDQLFTRIQSNVKFQPAETQPCPPPIGDSTVIMPRVDDTEKSNKSSVESVSAKPHHTTQNISPDNGHESTIHNEKHDHENEEHEHISIFSKEYLADFFTSARLAWGVVVAQFALLITLWLSSTGNGITAIGLDGKAINDIATINVVFADNATQKEIRELLASVDAQIANGPTSIGLYTIYIKGKETDAQSVINTLKKSTLILLAEPSFI